MQYHPRTMFRPASVVLLALLFVGCASTGPAKSPESAPSDEASPPPSSGSSTASGSEPPAAESNEREKPEKAEKSGPASVQDVSAILQLVIDDEALQPYLHLDKPDRFPFRIAGKDLPSGLELTKATKPVVIVADPSNEKKPTLVFTDLQIEADEATVRYRYDVEKIRGSSTLRRRDSRWILQRSRITER